MKYIIYIIYDDSNIGKQHQNSWNYYIRNKNVDIVKIVDILETSSN